MTNQPYTEDDLRTEAARYVAGHHNGLDLMTAMAIRPPWLYLPHGDFNAACGAVQRLLDSAADLSAWAVELGADGLEPVEDHLSMSADDRPLVRIHFAFDKDMPDEMRQACIEGVGQEIARYL